MEKISVRYVQEPLALMVDGELRLNPRNTVFWNDPGRFGARQHAAGFWSSADPGHVVFHETGHAAMVQGLYEAITRGGTAMTHVVTPEWVQEGLDSFVDTMPTAEHVDRALAEKILRQVGRHALVSLPEFVAEVFAGLMAGRHYDEDILTKYRDCGGPPVPGPA